MSVSPTINSNTKVLADAVYTMIIEEYQLID